MGARIGPVPHLFVSATFTSKPVICDAVGPGEDHRHDPRDVICGVEAIGAEILQNLHLERGDPAIHIHCDAGMDRLLPRMARGQQVLAPALLPAHGGAERTGQRGNGQLLPIERDLLAEGAAYVRADHRHLRLPDSEARGQLRPIGVRRLVAGMHGQVFAPWVPCGAATAWFQRRMGLTALGEPCFHDLVRLGKAAGRVPGHGDLMTDEVAGHRVIHRRRARQQGLRRAGDRRQGGHTRHGPARPHPPPASRWQRRRRRPGHR